MAPDRQCADAAAAGKRSIMHGGAVTEAHDVDVPLATKTTSASRTTTKEPEITRRDVHTASSLNAQRFHPKPNSKESNLAHQAALRRSSQSSRQESSSAAPSKPVLVRAPSKTDMKKKPKPRLDTGSPQFPPPENFSIQDILNSLGPEADASIDAIAEICGRSNMSLADEHGSHRPPHVQLMSVGVSPAESLPSMRLEPVAETTSDSPHTRSKSRSLALANASSGEMISSDATAATSNVFSLAHSNSSKRGREDHSSSSQVSAPLLSQIFAWLRRSDASDENSHAGAARLLQSLLSDTDSIRS